MSGKAAAGPVPQTEKFRQELWRVFSGKDAASTLKADKPAVDYAPADSRAIYDKFVAHEKALADFASGSGIGDLLPSVWNEGAQLLAMYCKEFHIMRSAGVTRRVMCRLKKRQPASDRALTTVSADEIYGLLTEEEPDAFHTSVKAGHATYARFHSSVSLAATRGFLRDRMYAVETALGFLESPKDKAFLAYAHDSPL